MSSADVARVLSSGGLAVVPTDTVYGLAGALHRDAITRAFALKGRPAAKALPVLAATPSDLEGVVDLDPRALRLAERFWPGPLTIVCRRASSFELDLGGAGDDTVAVRIPASDPLVAILRTTGPLAVTSANFSGAPPATTIEQARAVFREAVGAYVDGGVCDGAPSTVISTVGEPTILREGALPGPDLLQMLTE